MSGTLIPLAARGIDPTAAGQAYNSMLETGARIPLIGAQTQQAQAQAGLIGAQTGVAQQQGTALGIQNQMNQMLLGIRQQLYPQILPGGGGAQQPSQGLPWSPVSPQGGGGAAPAPTGGAIGANIVMPGAPSGAPTTAAPIQRRLEQSAPVHRPSPRLQPARIRPRPPLASTARRRTRPPLRRTAQPPRLRQCPHSRCQRLAAGPSPKLACLRMGRRSLSSHPTASSSQA